MINVSQASTYGLDERQAEIVNLIERRFNRAAIAAYLGVSTQTVRDVIGGMCDHYGCPASELPVQVLASGPSEISGAKIVSMTRLNERDLPVVNVPPLEWNERPTAGGSDG